MNEAFAKSAASFFEWSLSEPSSINWFKNALENGLDPNLPVIHEHYKKEGILVTAMRFNNIEAVLALLNAGASPHAYQDIMLSPYSLPRFLFPYHYILNNEYMTNEDKVRVTKAYIKSGAVFINLISEINEGWVNYDHRKYFENVYNNASTIFGFDVPETPSVCGGRLLTPICREVSVRTGRDWCKIMKELPVRVLWKSDSYDHRLLRFDLQYLLNVIDNRGYVLVTDNLGPNGGYALLEISADLKHWNLYKYTGPAVGMGHCKEGPDGSFSGDCWRRWSMTYSKEESAIKVSGYYEYEALFNCKKKRPED